MSKEDIQAIVDKLLSVRGSRLQRPIMLREEEVALILDKVRRVFMAEPVLCRVPAPVRIGGDTHGQFYDVLKILEKCGYPPEQRYLWLGDYVDRGKHSLELICLFYCFKILYPGSFYMLRGNHECAGINRMYGFYDDVKRRYNVKLWKHFTDVFNTMPPCGLVGERIVCMHGGIGPELQSMAMLESIERPYEVPDAGFVCDLLWADPEENVEGFVPSDRGVSYLFGEDVVEDFLNNVDMDLIVRAHQVMERGYSFFADRQLVTVFSAPNYCGEFDNDAAVMHVDEDLQCSFQILPAVTSV